MKQAPRGFTIVELLIVIVVIAILASITAVAYNGVTTRAINSEKATKLQRIKKALDLYAVDNNIYPTVPMMAGQGDAGARLIGLTLKDVEPTGFAYPGYGIEGGGNIARGITGFVYNPNTEKNNTGYICSGDPSDPAFSNCQSYIVGYWDYVADQAVTLRGSL